MKILSVGLNCLSAFQCACQNYRIGHKYFKLLAGVARYTVLHETLRDICVYQPQELTDWKYTVTGLEKNHDLKNQKIRFFI